MAPRIWATLFGLPVHRRQPATSDKVLLATGFSGRRSTPSGVSSTRNSVPGGQRRVSRRVLGKTIWPFVERVVVSIGKISVRLYQRQHAQSCPLPRDTNSLTRLHLHHGVPKVGDQTGAGGSCSGTVLTQNNSFIASNGGSNSSAVTPAAITTYSRASPADAASPKVGP